MPPAAREMMKIFNFKEELNKIRASRLAKNTGWMMLGQISSYAAQAAYFVVLSRLLGVTQFGILAGAVAFVSIFMPYGSMGSGIVFMRHVSADRNNCQLYMGHIFLCSITISGAIVLGLWILAPHVLDRQAASIVWIAAITGCLFTPFTLSISQVFQTFEMPRTMTAFNIINNVMRFLTALAFKIFVHQVHARQWAMADMCVSLCVTSIAIIVAIKHFGVPHISAQLFKKRILEGFGYSISSSTSSIYNDFDKTLLSHYGMTIANGIYSLAYRIINFATMPSYAIEMAAVPQLFQLAHGRAHEFRTYGKALIKRTTALGAIISLLLFIIAPVIPHVVGIGFQSSVLALRWLCLLPLFRSVHEITGSMLTASGYQKYRVSAQFMVAGITLILDIWLIPIHGWKGAAWVSLVSDALLAVSCLAILQIRLSFKEQREEKTF